MEKIDTPKFKNGTKVKVLVGVRDLYHHTARKGSKGIIEHMGRAGGICYWINFSNHSEWFYEDEIELYNPDLNTTRTVEERLTFYVEALEMLYNEEYRYACSAIQKLIKVRESRRIRHSDVSVEFPEIKPYTPFKGGREDSIEMVSTIITNLMK